MRELTLIFTNYSLFTFTTLILVALVNATWLQVFGHFPSAHLWIPTLVYWTLHRSMPEALLMTYILTFMVAALSVIPLDLLILTHLGIFLVTWLIRERLYWRGSIYFMLICGGVTLVFPVLHLVLSWLMEKNPIRDALVFDWVLRSLLTALISLPLYRLFSWLDRLTLRPSNLEEEDL